MTDTKLERFSAGESFAVDPDAIERELASLWREAGKSTEQSGAPVTRACLWNVVLHLEEREGYEGYGSADRLAAMVNELPRHLAARALVLRTRPNKEPSDLSHAQNASLDWDPKQAEGAQQQPKAAAERGGPALPDRDPKTKTLDAWISANCILAEGGGKLVCSEEINLASRGDGERHLPSLVRALLVPAVPTAVVFAGLPDMSSPAIKSLVQIADRVVTDVERSSLESPFARLREVIEDAPLQGMDIGWLQNLSLRSSVASLFDPPTPVGKLSRITEVRHTAPKHCFGKLMLGWIGSALKAHTPEEIGEGRWRLARKDLPPILLVLDECSDAGEIKIEFVVGDETPLWVHGAGGQAIELPGAKLTSERRHLIKEKDAALLARALATRSEDKAFKGAVRLAGDL